VPHGSPGVLHERREDWRWRAEHSQAERNTERSGVFLALETKFLLFWAGQEQDSVPSRSPATGASTASVFGSDSLDFSHAPGLDTGAGLGFPERFRASGPPDIPGNTSRPKGTPRKYQDGPSSWPRGRAQGRMGIPTTPVWQGMGIIAA
jgi:hypothetical protein